ncbi:MAG: NAD-binding protein [Gemmatimonadetes bacterium]|nr:NAD-binding protein [Gemmatimonadota bacterium]
MGRRPRGKAFYKTRARSPAWYHTAALLREFRLPLLGFLMITIGGGLLYGELYEAARGVSIPFIDRPFIMVQLMVLEAPERVPPEWYLVAFWYAMPPVFVILVAFGAADFVNLFLNRDSSRDPWGEALALTYKHHIIVFGAGHVGFRVIRDLVDMGLDVIAIDQSPNPSVAKQLSELGVPCIRDDARLPATLHKARLEHAETFIACTGDDHANLDAILKVRHAQPDIRIVSRVWDERSSEQLQQLMGVEAVISSADLAAPAFAGAAVGIEITQTLNVHGVEYSMIRMKVPKGSFMDGRTVGELQEGEQMDIVLHGCNGEAEVQPAHDTMVAAGDDLVMFARHDRLLGVVGKSRGAGRA